MTTPAQPAPAAPASPAAGPLEAWFDAELRPVLLQRLAAADGGAAARAVTRHQATLAALEHWLASLGQRSATWTPETHSVVTALAGEVRGLLDSAGPF